MLLFAVGVDSGSFGGAGGATAVENCGAAGAHSAAFGVWVLLSPQLVLLLLALLLLCSVYTAT